MWEKQCRLPWRWRLTIFCGSLVTERNGIATEEQSIRFWLESWILIRCSLSETWRHNRRIRDAEHKTYVTLDKQHLRLGTRCIVVKRAARNKYLIRSQDGSCVSEFTVSIKPWYLYRANFYFFSLVHCRILRAIVWTNRENRLVRQCRRQGVSIADCPLASSAVRVAHCFATACASANIGECINGLALSCVSRIQNWAKHFRQMCRGKFSSFCGSLATERNGVVVEEQRWFN